jgi:alkaline phosphatase
MKKQTAKYVDGFVFTVPKKNVAMYKKMAREAAEVWKKFGAIDYKECKGEELKTKASHGMPAPLSFSKLTNVKPNETVWFSYITYKTKAHRNQVNKKVMDYFNKKYADKMGEPMPFDVRKMAYGGFSVEVD